MEVTPPPDAKVIYAMLASHMDKVVGCYVCQLFDAKCQDARLNPCKFFEKGDPIHKLNTCRRWKKQMARVAAQKVADRQMTFTMANLNLDSDTEGGYTSDDDSIVI